MTTAEARIPFDHERLDVYRAALDLLDVTRTLVSRLPRTKAGASVADQIHRASMSVSLNIAEGAAEFSAPEKVKFYRYALRSTAECASILDVVARLYPQAGNAHAGKDLLHRITAMLLALIHRHERS